MIDSFDDSRYCSRGHNTICSDYDNNNALDMAGGKVISSANEDVKNSREVVMKLSVKAFALTAGIIWGLGLFILTWWIIIFEGSSTEGTFIGSIYRGYNVTALGSLIGLAWAFVDGLIVGAIFAWVYNLFVGGGSKS